MANMKEMPFDGNPEKFPDSKRHGSVSNGGSDLHGGTGREDDFATRNGLNLKSFTRSQSPIPC